MEHGNTNTDIAYLLRCVSASYTIRGVDRFRTIAYERAAEVIDHMSTQLYDLWKTNNLTKIDGLGKILTERIDDYFKNGKTSFLIQQYNETPENVYKLMLVPGIGVKTAYRLVTEFNLQKSDDIYKDVLTHCKNDSISKLPGFGAKSQAEIIISIESLLSKKYEIKRLRIDEAMAIYQLIADYLIKREEVVAIYPVGSLARFSPTVGDVDIVVVCKNAHASKLIKYFINYPQTKIVEGEGPHKGAIILTNGVHVQLRTIEASQLGAMLQYNTGSKEHNIKLRSLAQKKNLSISEYGIKKSGSKDVVENFESEEELYRRLGLQFIPPELRQGGNEIDLAKKKALPKLITLSDVKGDLQMHTNYPIEPSHDLGTASCEEMLIRASQLNYEYIAFTDHNPSISNHTDEDIVKILRTRQKAINELTYKKLERTNYLISLEVDIRPDGTIALPIQGLEFVDFILISIHSSFKQTRAEMTSRIIKAMQYPKVKIFAHPTGRLIGTREGVDADWDVIFKEAKRKKIALEINGAPERLDLPDNLIINAKKIGCLFSLGTDSHNLSQLDNMKYAVSLARRGGLEKNDIINSMDFVSVKNYLLNT